MSRDRNRRRRRIRRGWILPALVPLGALVWFLAEGADRRRAILGSVPEGAGERARNAGLGFGLLVGLAWIVLPVAYWSSRGTRRALAWCVARPPLLRVVLLPVAFTAGLGAALSGLLFALDAIAIVAAFLLTLLLGAWIVDPTLLGGQEALLEGLRGLFR
jgi:hypothetical protein